MNAAVSNFLRTLNIYYDKIVALAVLLALLVSLLMLLVRIGTDQAEHQRFTRDLQNLTALHPQPPPLNTSLFVAARQRYHEPYQLAAWDRHVTAPERRVHCVNCERPIVYDATVCPFCNHAQPAEAEAPTDWLGDGIPDAWAIEHGLDPRDPTHADQDFDGDGFSNIEEYLFETDPNDPQSFPAPWVRLRLDRIESEPFNMLFMGVSLLGEQNRQLFQVNMREGGRTHWAQLGDTVEGFVLDRYEPLEERQGQRVVDVSVLTLKRGDLEIQLVKGQATPHLQHRATMTFEIGEESRHTVVRGAEITLKGHTYQVVEIDPNNRRVQLRDSHNETLWIGTTSLSARKIQEARQ